MKYRLYGALHKQAKRLLRRNRTRQTQDSAPVLRHCSEDQLGCSREEAVPLWLSFIERSVLPEGHPHHPLSYAGYILDQETWCLSSWIWISAAVVRMKCRLGKAEEARALADRFLELQEPCGGWVVRNDRNPASETGSNADDEDSGVPILAPNDSAYIANHACLGMYLQTGEEKYLNAAERCADWIIRSARPDGMVYAGYDVRRQAWQIAHNIVDVGFTAGLFARLYEVTGQPHYYAFLERFTERYMELFFNERRRGFMTSLDHRDRPMGGMFGRGQAWALEGLIPASRVLKAEEGSTGEKVHKAVESTIDTLLLHQHKSGAWPYNLTRPLMGLDCKAASVIACSLMEWHALHPEREELRSASERALEWCIRHTSSSGVSRGGIFSYTIEGAVVQNFYTWTAFVYGSSYAVELERRLSEECP